MKAVQLDEYGGPDVLKVREVPDPEPGDGQVVVEVKAAGINPGEIAIREGELDDQSPANFPSGQGTDFAGIIRAVGPGTDDARIGEEVLGWSEERSSQAELVAVPVEQLTLKPADLSWERAGSLFVVGMAALASVLAVAPREGETVVVSAAAGGVGGVAVQLVRRTGARVIGLASEPNHDWLRAHDVIPVTYGDGQAERIRAAAEGPIDAFIDTFGGGYVDLAVELGVKPDRINTIIDYEAAEKVGAKTQGSHDIATADLLRDLADLVADGEVDLPIADTFPLDRVRNAFDEIAERHTHGKVALIPDKGRTADRASAVGRRGVDL